MYVCVSVTSYPKCCSIPLLLWAIGDSAEPITTHAYSSVKAKICFPFSFFFRFCFLILDLFLNWQHKLYLERIGNFCVCGLKKKLCVCVFDSLLNFHQIKPFYFSDLSAFSCLFGAVLIDEFHYKTVSEELINPSWSAVIMWEIFTNPWSLVPRSAFL